VTDVSAGSPVVDVPKVFLVCGAGRSATSQIAKHLHDGGLPMGDNLMAPSPANPHGYYEDMAAVSLNGRILGAHQVTWSTVEEPLPVEHLEWVERLRDYIHQRMAAAHDGPWGVKDPRITMTIAYWLEALAGYDVEPVVVGCIRDTDAVARSLQRSERMDRLWALTVTHHYQQALAGIAGWARLRT